MSENQPTAQSNYILIVTAVFFGGLIGAYFLMPSFHSFLQEAYQILTSGEEERISEWVKQFDFWGPLFIVFATILQMFLLLVNVVLLVLVSILAYGPWWGSLLGIASICIASTVGYFIGKALGPHTIYKLIGEKSEKKAEGFMEKYGLIAIVIARLSPFLSNDAISFVAGLLKLNYFRFMAATLAGIVPLVALIAWMSEDMERLKNGLIWVSAISIAGLAAYIVYDKYYKKDS